MLKELIDQFYLDQQEEQKQAKFYITDAGKCPRAIFFKFKNVPREKMEARIMRIFEKGEHMHRNIFNVLYRLRIGVTTEVSIPAQEIISGRADAILCINNENYVLDIKSINSMVFRTLYKPKEENLCQIQLYLHFFKIPKGILMYIDKDRQEIKEFIVEYDSQLVHSLLKGFKELKQKIEKNVVPERMEGYPKSWQCQYCQYKEICKTAGSKKIDWEEFKREVSLQEQGQSKLY